MGFGSRRVGDDTKEDKEVVVVVGSADAFQDDAARGLGVILLVGLDRSIACNRSCVVVGWGTLAAAAAVPRMPCTRFAPTTCGGVDATVGWTDPPNDDDDDEASCCCWCCCFHSLASSV